VNVDPQTPATVYAATLAGLFKPLNGGVAWAQHTPRVFGVPAIDPETPTTLYGGGGLAGLRGPFKSTDGGATWSPSSVGLPADSVRVVAIDPQPPATLYVGTASSGVFKSVDGGASFGPRNVGLTDLRLRGNLKTALVVAPVARARARHDVGAAGVPMKQDSGA